MRSDQIAQVWQQRFLLGQSVPAAHPRLIHVGKEKDTLHDVGAIVHEIDTLV
eukprot:CAMPEP_0202063980 /NCGR_PEP_ID=MMETSP0963-20130614/47885_1 /ASSEMBLY_ACC=CAM_ASM_000494 /TAXON_ID=4773 /ORGANISM="Schizochytrium aggregatum, Strain ATCC28209" /LENGTH=51 /DNA_ID=CAMNT_0048630417 /DNA_START=131 /DNA_END=283 /DNA_ORIENTATION=+